MKFDLLNRQDISNMTYMVAMTVAKYRNYLNNGNNFYGKEVVQQSART